VAHQTFAVLAESDNGRGGAETFRVSDHDRLAAFHHGHAAVGRSQVNTDNLAHNESPIFKFLPPANQSERGDFLRPYISKTRAKC
jgi:NAD-specific glutamate dehydrogenase.